MARTAVVTGAGTGIGRAVARKLLAEGFFVLGIGRRREVLQEAAQSFGLERARFQFRTADVRNLASLVDAMTSLERIDAVVANAGIVRQARLEDPEADRAWRDVLSANLDGAFNTLRASEPRIANRGRIVIVSSGLGKLGRSGFGAYCASKHGVLGLMKCVSKELAGRGITVNAVCPGWVETDMACADIDRMSGDNGCSTVEVRAQIQRNIALGRFVRPEEVASLVTWLISDEAGAITGEAFNISCGEFFA